MAVGAVEVDVGLFLRVGARGQVQVLKGDSRRCATAYWTISDSELMPIFCMMRVLCVLTVFTLRCRLLAISVIDLPATSREKTSNSRSDSCLCSKLSFGIMMLSTSCSATSALM